MRGPVRGTPRRLGAAGAGFRRVGLAMMLIAGCWAASATDSAAAPLASADDQFSLSRPPLQRVAPSAGTATVPFFSDEFSYEGTNYPYTMVGTNPRTEQVPTLVRSSIVPLELVFADGHVTELQGSVGSTVISPLFNPAHFKSGGTQYGDAMRRAMFWSYVAGTHYHLRLKKPVVLPVQRIEVPEADGEYVPAGTPLGTLGQTTIHAAAPLGVVAEPWFSQTLIHTLEALHADPHTLPILLTRNVIVQGGEPGFHDAYASEAGEQTFVWASYGEPYFFEELPEITKNVDILSHEIAEWMSDPFVSNVVPAWKSPQPVSAGFYGCSNLLETGDPVPESTFEVDRVGGFRGFQLADQAFLSWFAHQEPSIGIKGQYTYMSSFGAPAPSC